MSDSSSEHNRIRAKSRAPRLLGCCFGLPVLLIVICFVIIKLNNRPPELVVPTHTVPADNARDYFRKAYSLAQGMKHKTPSNMPGTPAQTDTYANFAASAKNAIPALQMMREGLKHPFIEPPVHSISSIGVNRAYAEFRDLARVNSGAADFEAISGHPGRAAQMRLDGMEMAVMLPRGGNFISDMVGFACEAIAEHRLEPLLPKLSAQELAQVAERLDQIEAKRTSCADIIMEQGNSDIAIYLEIFRDPKFQSQNPFTAASSLVNGQTDGNDNDNTSFHERLENGIKLTRFVLKSKAAMLEQDQQWFKERAEEARKPYVGKSRVPTPDNFLGEEWGPMLDHFRIKSTAKETVSLLLRVETALYRYKAAQGRFPETLAELCPIYLKAVPDDPFGGATGKPLRYQAKEQGKSFLLYSLGPDLHDEGGVSGKNYESIPGDIVAGHLYNSRPILYSSQEAKP